MIDGEIPESLRHAPEYVRQPIKDFFDHVVRQAPDLYDATARTLLVRYCEIWNELEDVKEERTRDHISPTFKDKHGQPRIHPLVKHEVALTNELGKIFRLLGWDQAAQGSQIPLFQ